MTLYPLYDKIIIAKCIALESKMSKFIKLAAALLVLITLTACDAAGDGDNMKDQGDDFKLSATVIAVNEKIEVDVVTSQYASGIYLVITSTETEYYDNIGNKISREEICVGDTVEILYGGQVMMSYPPQIVAARITVK